MRLSRFRLVLPLGALLAASPVSAQGAERLPDLRGARSIVILDEWTGEGTPVVAAYRIDRQDETWFFAGTAQFSVGGGARRQNAMVALPDSAAVRFLAALSAVPVRAGEYRPTRTHTDDYPSLTIRLEFGDGTVEFHTTSQGEGHRPWRVRMHGPGGERTLVSDSDAPWRALRALHPYLKRDVLEALQRAGTGR